MSLLQVNINLSEVKLLEGKLNSAILNANRALDIANHISDLDGRCKSNILLGSILNLRGDCRGALNAFREYYRLRHETSEDIELTNSQCIFQHALLLSRLGRYDEANRLAQNIQEIPWHDSLNGKNYLQNHRSNLLIAESLLHSSKDLSLSKSRTYYELAQDWALTNNNKELLCWSALVRARIELMYVKYNSKGNVANTAVGMSRLQTAQTAIVEGLNIASECGYGIYCIDLLLEVTYLRLFQGDYLAALANLELILDDSISSRKPLGNATLLSAKHSDCGYIWGVAQGFHLKAEALLLQAAQMMGSKVFIPVLKHELPQELQSLISEAETCLTIALKYWQDLRDPEVSDSNFIQPNTGKEYNFRARETYRILSGLREGELTKYPLTKQSVGRSMPIPLSKPLLTSGDAKPKRFKVALSFPGEHREFVADIAEALADSLDRQRVFYDKFYEAELARPNLDTYLQRIYHKDADLIVVFICEVYDQKDWTGLEFRAIRDLIKNRQRRDEEIMFVRVDEGDVAGVFSIDGYVDAQGRPADEIAGLICQRLARLPPQ